MPVSQDGDIRGHAGEKADTAGMRGKVGGLPGICARACQDFDNLTAEEKNMKRLLRYAALFAGVLTTMLFMAEGVMAADKLSYRLKWLFNTSVVGDLYADVRGHFQEARLSVDVKSGGPERDAIKELELGQAEFGVASADQVIRALAKGAPVVVIAQLFQVNPLQWIYRQNAPPISQLADLKGRVIGVTYGGNDETIMRTLLAKAGLAEPDVKLFNVRYDYTPFYRGRSTPFRCSTRTRPGNSWPNSWPLPASW